MLSFVLFFNTALLVALVDHHSVLIWKKNQFNMLVNLRSVSNLTLIVLCLKFAIKLLQLFFVWFTWVKLLLLI